MLCRDTQPSPYCADCETMTDDECPYAPDPRSVADRSDRTSGSLAAQRTDSVETNAVNSPPVLRPLPISGKPDGVYQCKFCTFSCDTLKEMTAHLRDTE